MASKKNKSLYDLVQTLSPVEKRFLQNHLRPQSSKAKLLLAAFAEETEPSEAVLRDVYAQSGNPPRHSIT